MNKIVTTFTLFLLSGFSTIDAQHKEITEYENQIYRLENIRTILTDSLSLVNSQIDSLNALISQIHRSLQDDSDQLELRIISDARIYDSNHVSSNIIGRIPKESEVVIVGIDGSHYIEILHNNRTGFIMRRHFEDQDAIERLIRDDQMREREHNRYIDSLIASVEINSSWVSSEVANLRNKPTTESTVISQLKMGDKIFIQESKDNWLYIYYLNNLQDRRNINSQDDINEVYKSGWIHGNLVWLFR